MSKQRLIVLIAAIGAALILAVAVIDGGAFANLDGRLARHEPAHTYSARDHGTGETGWAWDAGQDGALAYSSSACDLVGQLIEMLVEGEATDAEYRVFARSLAHQAEAEGRWQIAANASTFASGLTQEETKDAVDRMATLCGMAPPYETAARQKAEAEQRKRAAEATARARVRAEAAARIPALEAKDAQAKARADAAWQRLMECQNNAADWHVQCRAADAEYKRASQESYGAWSERSKAQNEAEWGY